MATSPRPVFSLTDIPPEVTANIVGSFDTAEEVVERRRLGGEWYRRYLRLLPLLVNERAMFDYGTRTKDEDFLVDLLILNLGDLGDHPDLDEDLRTTTLTWLERFVMADLSQEFGYDLTRLPIFVVNLTITLDKIFSHVYARLSHIINVDHVTAAITRTIETMLHFDSITNTVLLPWVRRYPEYRSLMLRYNDNNDAIQRLLELFQDHKIDLHSQDIRDIYGNVALSDDNRQRLSNYPYVE